MTSLPYVGSKEVFDFYYTHFEKSSSQNIADGRIEFLGNRLVQLKIYVWSYKIITLTTERMDTILQSVLVLVTMFL